MSKGTHFGELDAYRGIAALTIVAFHAYVFAGEAASPPWPFAGTVVHLLLMNADMAVTCFFVLSGLLVGLPFARAAIDQHHPVAIGQFL